MLKFLKVTDKIYGLQQAVNRCSSKGVTLVNFGGGPQMAFNNPTVLKVSVSLSYNNNLRALLRYV